MFGRRLEISMVLLVAAIWLGILSAGAAAGEPVHSARGEGESGPAKLSPGVYLGSADEVATGKPGRYERVVTGPDDGGEQGIVGGNTTSVEQWPWMVAMTLNPNQYGGGPLERFFCGGTLVSPTLVITAAHCLSSENGKFYPASDFAVITGRTTLSNTGQGQEQLIKNYYPLVDGNGKQLWNPNQLSYDTVLVELRTPVSQGTVRLAGAGEKGLWDGSEAAWVTGWGLTSSNGNISNQLRVAQIAMVPDNQCNRHYGDLNFKTMVCAGGQGGRDTCNGDSGGPLVVKAGDGSFRLVGDTSFGPAKCGSTPGVYARIAGDAMRENLRQAALQIAGVDIVSGEGGNGGSTGGGGGTGQPPTGGGGGGGSLGALTFDQARKIAKAKSLRICQKKRRCWGYWETCKARSGKFKCNLYSYFKKPRKYTCKQRIKVFANGQGRIVTQKSGRKRCGRGWWS